MRITETNVLVLAQALMEQSIRCDSVAHHEFDWLLAEQLSAMCEGEDNVTDGNLNEAEYWGTDDDGNEWRVHLVRR